MGTPANKDLFNATLGIILSFSLRSNSKRPQEY